MFILVFMASLPVFGNQPKPNDDSPIYKCGFHFNFENNTSSKKTRIQEKPPLDSTYATKSGNFVIHYTLRDSDAVSPYDGNGNGIPDYVDSVAYYFDYAYNVEVKQLHYRNPTVDDSGKNHKPIDVYLVDLGNGGLTTDVGYGYTFRDEELPRVHFKRWTSYMLIDNNYSSRDSVVIDTKGTKKRTFYDTSYAALKISAAHEFHHTIQAVYGMDDSSQCLNEFMSTYMEYRVHPSTTDYYQFVRSLFGDLQRWPFGNGEYLNGYRHAIFGQYINSKYGDLLLLRMWELIGEGNSGYKALDSAFKERNSSLVDEWNDYLPWLYYTGNRAVQGKYFAQADKFPEVYYYDDDSVFSLPAYIKKGELQPLEIRAHRCIFPLTGDIVSDIKVDVFLANTDVNSAIYQQFKLHTEPYSINFSQDNSTNSIAIGSSGFSFLFDAPQGYVKYKLFYPEIQSACYPNPFNPAINSEMHFPVTDNLGENAKVLLNIYNANMKIVYTHYLTVTINDMRGIVILKDMPNDISSGVYIYSVKYENSEIFGKFVVVK